MCIRDSRHNRARNQDYQREEPANESAYAALSLAIGIADFIVVRRRQKTALQVVGLLFMSRRNGSIVTHTLTNWYWRTTLRYSGFMHSCMWLDTFGAPTSATFVTSLTDKQKKGLTFEKRKPL